MLTSLSIKNFTIVAALELDFSSGMTAFTGETGAGKSIMIDALMLALGGRADAQVVRPGQVSCDIQARFSFMPHSAPAQWLEEHEIASDDDIILRRVISAEGRSKAFINGVAFPLQKIKELSEYLIHIHGQHEHQTLLSHSTHRQQLDDFAQHSDLCDAVAQSYRMCQALEAERDALADLDLKQIDELTAQIIELEELAPKEDELEHLHIEHQNLHHAKDYLEQTQALHDLMQGENQASIRHTLHQSTQLLARLPSENTHIASATQLLEQAIILCDEAYDDMTAFSRQVQLDPERLLTIENRMSALHHFARKYHIDAKQLSTHMQRLEQKQQSYQLLMDRQSRIEQEHSNAQQAYQTAALALRQSRQLHAPKLAALITENIKQLAMPHGYVDLDITPLDHMHPHGMDKVEYKVSSNPGMKADALSKIASGGELSRISLAIQMIAAQQGATPSLIFDEVDVGIGGTTAAIVGRLLRRLGERLQVFCVTHQAQVAASAHHHFQVKKYIQDQETFSQISVLSTDTKIEEIARMLGGLTITQQTRSHAQELIDALTAEGANH